MAANRHGRLLYRTDSEPHASNGRPDLFMPIWQALGILERFYKLDEFLGSQTGDDAVTAQDANDFLRGLCRSDFDHSRLNVWWDLRHDYSNAGGLHRAALSFPAHPA